MARLLVIDDDPLVQRTLDRLLAKAGHEVHLAANGLEGLHAFRHLRPDVVVTDIVMPVKEGLDTILLLRDWCPGVRIIAISGGGRMDSTDLLAKAAECGADAVLAKPFEPGELLAKIEECLAPPVEPEVEADLPAPCETAG